MGPDSVETACPDASGVIGRPEPAQVAPPGRPMCDGTRRAGFSTDTF